MIYVYFHKAKISIFHFRLGYQECMSEAMRFMVEVEGHFPREAVCVRLLNHLQKHCESIARAPHFSSTRNTNYTTEHIVPVPNAHEPAGSKVQMKVGDCLVAKSEPEQNNNNSSYVVREVSQSSENDYEKAHLDNTNGMSYKYKTNIKLRFTQDINGGPDAIKRQKLENGRRNSLTSSTENQR